ncbi:MAG: hypothetical protein KAS32_28660 [Candidatus Peribacteraceae bacterium]|nr:hypothetical protein [Candidatus Peribacteraceae bacterium]
MYLIIHEDNHIQRCPHLPEGIKEWVDRGYGSLIRVDGDVPMSYYDGKWSPVEECK